MPAKPSWCSRINDIIRELDSLPRPFVDRATVEFLLGIGRRRAQQILAPCITERIGASGLANRDMLIARLRSLAAGDEVHYERRRRLKVARALAELRKQRLENPQVLVEAPLRVVSQRFENLPEGVRLEPNQLTITFAEPREALEKLLALAMAIGNDFELFERAARGPGKP